MKELIISFLIIFSLPCISFAQFHIPPKDIVESAPEWAQLMYGENPNIFEVEQKMRAYYRGQKIPKNTHTRNFKFFKKSVRFRTNRDGSIASKTNKTYKARLAKAQNRQRTKNAAGNWSLVGPIINYTKTGIPSADQSCIYTIDQSLSNPNIMFCGTEPGEVYKSTDGGENWVNMTLNLALPFDGGSIRSVAIHPTNPSIIYFAINELIFRSTDGGINWNNIHSIPIILGDNRVEKIFIHPVQTNIIMIASSEGLARSTDNGASWTNAFDDPTTDIEMNTASSNIIYTLRVNDAAQLPEFLISTDFGATFSLVSNGWYTSTNAARATEAGRIAVTEADPNRVYAYLIGQSKPGDAGFIGLYRSDDGGNTWTLPRGSVGGPYNLANKPNPSSFDGLVDGGADISFCALAVSNQDPDKLLFGGFNIWKSDDGGATFDAHGGYINGLLNTSVQGFHVDMQEFKVFGNTTWLTTDGGIYKSNDFFSTSTGFGKKNKGVHSTDFWGFGAGWNEDVLVGGLYHNGVIAHRETWGAGNFMALGGGEPSSGYVNPGQNELVYSTDVDGVLLPAAIGPTQNFDYTFIPNESSEPLDEGYSDLVFHPQCYSVAFTGQLNELWRTTDKGLNFESIHNFGGGVDDWVTYIHISRFDHNIMYVCQRDEANGKAKLWKSTDAAATWIQIAVPADVSEFMILRADPHDPNKLWIGSSDFTNPTVLYQSTNGGATWTSIVSPVIMDEYLLTLDYIPGTDGGLYLGTNLGMYYKNNSMTNWMDFSNGLPVISTARKTRPFYRDNKLRLSSTKGVWESELFERPNQPFAQIMVDRIDECTTAGSGFTFVDYSILKHQGATWQWTFQNGTPATASTWKANVTFNTPGTHQVTLTVTDDRGLTSTDVMNITIGGGGPSLDILSTPMPPISCGVEADIRVFLQGAYNGVEMRDDLRLNNLLPLSQPYTADGYAGTESVASIPGDIVDWVLVQLRSTRTTIVAERAAFLRNDGAVVDLDGFSLLSFPNAASGNYYISVKHRNHLGVMTNMPVALD